MHFASIYNPICLTNSLFAQEKFKREFRRRFPFFRLRSEPSQSEPSDQTVSMYTRASSIRSVCHTASQRNKSTASTALQSGDSSIGGPGGTKRSCSFNYIEQSANPKLNADRCGGGWPKSTWVPSAVKFDQQNGGDYYPKVVYQHVSSHPEDGIEVRHQQLSDVPNCDRKTGTCVHEIEDEDCIHCSDDYVEL